MGEQTTGNQKNVIRQLRAERAIKLLLNGHCVTPAYALAAVLTGRVSPDELRTWGKGAKQRVFVG